MAKDDGVAQFAIKAHAYDNQYSGANPPLYFKVEHHNSLQGTSSVLATSASWSPTTHPDFTGELRVTGLTDYTATVTLIDAETYQPVDGMYVVARDLGFGGSTRRPSTRR